MSNIKEIKKFNLAPLFLTIFIFVRAVVLTDKSRIGIGDIYNLEINFSYESLTLVILFLLFAVLASLVITKLSKNFGEDVSYICVLLVTEPLLFVKQADCISMLVMVLGLLFILNGLREKPIIPNEITLIVFVLSATILVENALFLFVAPALMFYFLDNIENIFKSAKKLIMLFLSLFSMGTGIYLNDFFTTKYSNYSNFIERYSFYQNIYFKHLKYETYLLLIFTIPTIVLGIFFFVNLIKNSVVKDQHKKKKTLVDEAASIAPKITIGVVIAAYILSFVGFALKGSQGFYTVNYIIPIVLFTLIKQNIHSANKTIQQINDFIGKHSFAFITVLVVFYYLSIRVFYSDVDNLSTFMIMI